MGHPYLFLADLFHWPFAHHYPWVAYSWVAMLFLMAIGWMAAKGIKMIPTGSQNVLEAVVSGIEDFMVDITGEHGRFLLPLIATLFLYIFTCNLMGLIPGFFSPTASVNTTLSCALVVVIYTHILGVKCHGPKYIKHFMGPVWWMAPLIFPIEIIGHLARVLSLTIRLFGNMMGHELVVGILFFLAGAFLAPLPIMAMGIFVCFIQAFVFTLLSIMYFSGALEHAH
ncbi:MAG: F0F1 ATP synthase subunit A [Deltaproteobacteria bacterium]|nr:F0F1 ATP synthase subunit A [Deltaproteobacteria bacterium]